MPWRGIEVVSICKMCGEVRLFLSRVQISAVCSTYDATRHGTVGQGVHGCYDCYMVCFAGSVHPATWVRVSVGCSFLLWLGCGSGVSETLPPGDSPNQGGCATTSDCDLGSFCLSGVCGSEQCLQDEHCDRNSICDGGACVAALCSTLNCDGVGEMCCGDECVAADRMNAFCGDCTTACAAGDYCSTGTCTALSLGVACAGFALYGVQDQFVEDNSALAAMVASLGTCNTAPTITLVQADDAEFTMVDGCPRKGPATVYLVAGGSYGQPMAGYLGDAGLAPVVYEQGNNYDFVLRRTDSGVAVVSENMSQLSNSRDYAVIQSAYVEEVGAVVINVFGVFGKGTQAAAWYFANQVITSSASADQWLVLLWTDDGDGEPGAGDVFERIAP